jgi:hypothetical protein
MPAFIFFLLSMFLLKTLLFAFFSLTFFMRRICLGRVSRFRMIDNTSVSPSNSHTTLGM